LLNVEEPANSGHLNEVTELVGIAELLGDFNALCDLL